MIPKKIHYCWFGGNQLPNSATKCIDSWKKYCPDYEIIEWNEGNFNVFSCPRYIQEAYVNKKWAFVTDYVRLKVIYDRGGIYLDTDVELKKNLDSLLIYNAYFGLEDKNYINTGLGFGSIARLPLLKELMDDYENISFVRSDGSFDKTPCPQRNTPHFIKYGFNKEDKTQVIDDNILILSSIYLCPISYRTNVHRYSLKTYSIHWFQASWHTEEERQRHKYYSKKRKREYYIDRFVHAPNRILRNLLGDTRYDWLKRKLKG